MIKIQDLTKKPFQQYQQESVDREVSQFLNPMSREDFFKDIETAEEQIVDGGCKKSKEVFHELEQRYGF